MSREETAPVELTCDQFSVGMRLDQFLASRLEASRSALQDWIKDERVLLDGRSCKPSQKLKLNQKIQVWIPPVISAVPLPDPSIELDLVFEDEHMVVVNKPRGLVVHPAPGNPDKTLVNALLAHCNDWSGIGGVSRPGIVHRLDKDTSGLMVVAKHDAAHQALSQQFAQRSVIKIYLALVHGIAQPKRGRINQPLARHPKDRLRMACLDGGKPALTDYEVLRPLGGSHSLLELRLHTGRTHQIRVHLAWLGYPIVADPIYGRSGPTFGLTGQALHSTRLALSHPVDGRQLEFHAEMPPDMALAVDAMSANP